MTASISASGLQKLCKSESKLTAMKVLTALFCLIAVGTASSVPSCQGRPNGSFMADPIRCNYYYACINGRAMPVSCPSGLLFNEVRLVCDSPSRAGCIQCPVRGVGNVSVAGDCKKFVQCFQGVASDRECPAGLLFDTTLGQCNLEQNVRC